MRKCTVCGRRYNWVKGDGYSEELCSISCEISRMSTKIVLGKRLLLELVTAIEDSADGPAYDVVDPLRAAKEYLGIV
jgi:hypothetical protein